MRQFHNTPSLFNPPCVQKHMDDKELLIKLQNQYDNYRDDCNRGYCKIDYQVISSLRDKIALQELKIIKNDNL